MPVIGIPVEELTSRLGREIERGELLRILGEIGCDVEGYETLARVRCAACGFVLELVGKEEAPPRCDRCDADLRASTGALVPMPGIEVIRMDLLAVRPDIFDPGGLARALRGIFSIETGLPQYEVGPANLRLRVDDSVRRARSSRPYIVCAVLENVTLNEDRVKILMKLQENLHWALGRDRKHASIGVYDLDSLGLSGGAGGSAREAASDGAREGADGTSAVLAYGTDDPDSCAFVPLGATGLGDEHRRTLRQILEAHPKGMAYAHLLTGFDRYPILRTAQGTVLSMPPIVNSEQTKVHLGSRRLFVDVTGTIERVVHRTLNILVTSLLEMDPKAKLRAVRIENATGGDIVTPDLRPQEAWCGVERTRQLLGFPLTGEDIRTLLLRMRHGVGEIEDCGDPTGRQQADGAARETRLRVLVPAYRNDILHERDLLEDVAIAYGYANVPRTLVPTQTVGKPDPREVRSEHARDVLIGLGLIEVLNLVLTCPEQSDGLLDRADHPATVLLDNPISQEQTQLRTSLIPGILTTFARNRHNPLPQGIFEVGDVTLLDAAAETGAREVRHLALGLISPKVGFADIRALVEAVVREFGWVLRVQPCEPGFLLEGRGGSILGDCGAGKSGGEPTVAGVFGEIHPRVLERLGLQNPTVVCELALPTSDGPMSYGSLP
jgi:phenylalanyl-tRNA synthetase beta chain